MNWKEIKNKYPKAFKLARDKGIIGKTSDSREYFTYTKSIRDLYDFFDELKIFISIATSYGSDISWEYDIRFKYVAAHLDIITFNTRKEAEQAVFNKAFELLEEKL